MDVIRVGDLVMVVRWPHEHAQDHLGRIYSVIGFSGHTTCHDCLYHFSMPSAMLTGPKGDGYIPIAWLKKINPPADERTTEHEKELAHD